MELRENTRTYTVRRITAYSGVKRGIDMMVSFLVLLLSAPVILIVYMILRKKEGTPCLLREERVGKDNRIFTMWSFRTTTVPSRVIRGFPPYAFANSWTEGVPDSFIRQADAGIRITKIGAFLYKYKLDKLPQFMNILKGDMSLVGPQPEIPELADYYNVVQQKRLQIRPGMTGYAQANGLVTEEKHGRKIAYDLYYLRNYSFWFDIKIIWYSLFRRALN